MKKFTLSEIKQTDLYKEDKNKLLAFLEIKYTDNDYITIKQLIEIIGLRKTLKLKINRKKVDMFSDYKKEMILFSINCIKKIEHHLKDGRPLGLLEKCKKSIDFLQNEKELDNRYKNNYMILHDLNTNLKKYKEYINAKSDFDSYEYCNQTALKEYGKICKQSPIESLDYFEASSNIYTIEAILTLRDIGKRRLEQIVPNIIHSVCGAVAYRDLVRKKEIKKIFTPIYEKTYIEFESILTKEFLYMLVCIENNIKYEI